MHAIEEIIKSALEQKLLDDKSTVIGIMDYDGLEQTVTQLHDSFPPYFSHAFAVKANPLVSVLAKLRELGMLAEVASPGELELSLAAGFAPTEIIFDSPTKTWSDLETCIKHGISINMDNEQELARVDALMQKYPNSISTVGFRINPQVGAGGISSTSTATSTSKFGYALRDEGKYEYIIQLYKDRPWMTSIHTHAGSQGCALELIGEAIKSIVDLAEAINQQVGYQQITKLDIGGGLPVNFDSDEVRPTFADYVRVLHKIVPNLFSGKYHVKTEFGRAITAKNGCMITKVEYVKQSGGRQIAQTHVGVQVATRTIYLPKDWPLRVIAFDSSGNRKTSYNHVTDVGGPCCFSGDLVAKGRDLPVLESGDYLAVLDTGAYYFSAHFDYNSIPTTRVFAISKRNEVISFDCIREESTMQELVIRMGANHAVSDSAKKSPQMLWQQNETVIA